MPGFSSYFAKDYAGAAELAKMLGYGRHEVTIVAFGMRETYDSTAKEHYDKPVMYLEEVGLGKKAVFVNSSSHEAMERIFGEGYDDRQETLGRTVLMEIKRQKVGKEMKDTAKVLPLQLPDPRAKAGEAVAKRMAEALRQRGLEPARGRDEFLRWLAPRQQKLWNKLTSEEFVADWPRAFMRHFKAWLDETDKQKRGGGEKGKHG